MALPADFRPLKKSLAFRRLWVGQAVSQIGTQMSLIAVSNEG